LLAVPRLTTTRLTTTRLTTTRLTTTRLTTTRLTTTRLTTRLTTWLAAAWLAAAWLAAARCSTAVAGRTASLTAGLTSFRTAFTRLLLLVVLLLARLLTRLPPLMVENPFHRLAVIGAVGGDRWLGWWRAGRLTIHSLAIRGWLVLPSWLPILGPTVPAGLGLAPRSLLAILRPLLARSGPLLTTRSFRWVTAIGSFAFGLPLVTGGLSATLTTALVAGLLVGTTLRLRLASRRFAVTRRVSGLPSFPGLTSLGRLLASSRLPGLLLGTLRPLLTLPFFRPRRATGVLHARLAPLLTGLLLVVGRGRLVLRLGHAAARLRVGILPRRLLGLGVSGTICIGCRGIALAITALILRLPLRPLRLWVGRGRSEVVYDQLPPRRGRGIGLGLPVVEHHGAILKHVCAGGVLRRNHPGADPQATAAPGVGLSRVGLPELPLPHGTATQRPRFHADRSQRIVGIDRPHPNPNGTAGRHSQFLFFGMIDRHLGREIGQHLNPMREWLGDDVGSPGILFATRAEAEPIRGVLSPRPIGRQPQGQAGAGQGRLLRIDRQPQVVLPLGVEEVDPGGIERLIRFDLQQNLSSLQAPQVALPLTGFRGAAGVHRKPVLSLTDQQRGGIDHQHRQWLQAGIAGSQAEPDRSVKPGGG
jgi:hypothetical protein